MFLADSAPAAWHASPYTFRYPHPPGQDASNDASLLQVVRRPAEPVRVSKEERDVAVKHEERSALHLLRLAVESLEVCLASAVPVPNQVCLVILRIL